MTLKRRCNDVPATLSFVGMGSTWNWMSYDFFFFITAVRITFRGQAFVHWTEQKVRGGGEPRYKDTHHHSASENYFEHSIVLYGRGMFRRMRRLKLSVLHMGRAMRKSITKTYLYNFDPLKPHFYIVKLGSTGVCIIFLISAKKT